MKKIIIVSLFQAVSIFASDNDYIDRSGWHFGMGVSLFPGIGGGDMFEKGKLFVIPTLNMSLDYGVSSQLSIGLESKNLLIIGLNTLYLKYYTIDAINSTYFTGGISLPYSPDDFDEDNEDNETAPVGVKIGIGYAWNHTELEASVHHDKSTYFDLSWRYKF